MPKSLQWLITITVGWLVVQFITDWQRGDTSAHALVGFFLQLLLLVFSMIFCVAGRKPLESLSPGAHHVLILYRGEENIHFMVRHEDENMFWHREYRLSLKGFYGDDLRSTGTLHVTAIPTGKMYLYARDKDQ